MIQSTLTDCNKFNVAKKHVETMIYLENKLGLDSCILFSFE